MKKKIVTLSFAHSSSVRNLLTLEASYLQPENPVQTDRIANGLLESSLLEQRGEGGDRLECLVQQSKQEQRF